VADATWLAQLGAHGLVRGSFVPPEPIRQLRDLTRTRTAVTRERTREIQRLEKLLEDAGIKLSSVAADLNGASSRAMLEALLAGETDPAAMAELAKKRMRVKIPQLTEALYGRFTSHHAFLTRMHLDLIDQHTAAIEQLTDRIEVVMEPFRSFRDLICTIPGIGGYTADVVVAETGADMTRFPTAQHLASWAGTTPGNNESAGKVKSRRTRPGNPYLQGALGTAAMSISHTRDTYLAAKYRRIATRRGPLRANVAVQRALLVAIWNIATTNTAYHDPGGDYFTRLNPQKARKQRRPPTRSLGLPRHPRPGILTGPLTHERTSRQSSRQVIPPVSRGGTTEGRRNHLWRSSITCLRLISLRTSCRASSYTRMVTSQRPASRYLSTSGHSRARSALTGSFEPTAMYKGR
jgi:transposase